MRWDRVALGSDRKRDVEQPMPFRKRTTDTADQPANRQRNLGIACRHLPEHRDASFVGMARAGQRALLRSREIQTEERRSVEAKGGHQRLVLVELDRRPAELGADDAGV